jgi:RND family efflux transporter MFP subunit
MKTILIKSISAIVLGGGLFVLVQSCTESQGKGSPIPRTADPIPVQVLELHQSEALQSVVTSGRLTTDDETLLAFKTGGVVNAVFVDEGDRVAKGQTLATLDLTEINSSVAQAKTGMEKAERDLQRAKNLYRDSVATLEQLQNAETAFELARQQYKSASFNQSYSQIKAPASGYVLKKFVNAGQVVGVGDPILRTNGAGDGKWILKTGVSDKQWSAISINDRAEVRIDAFPEHKFEGSVIRKSETADPVTGAFTVEVTVKNKNLRLAAGMFASAIITGSDSSSAWNIPYEAVLDANGSEGFVFVTTDNKTALKKAVVIESFNGATIRVNSGLEGARTLIVSGSAYLTDNSPIRIVK